MNATHRPALIRLSFLVTVFGLGCGLCDACAGLTLPPPTTKQVSPSDVASTFTMSCSDATGTQQVTIHLNVDATLEIEIPPSQIIVDTWTIEKNEIVFHYKAPVEERVYPNWYVAEVSSGKFDIVQSVDPEACFWLR